ncbi:MAG: EpsG family protein [Bacteroidales bacterium]|nr:EpsG family protein [Bacteroidales bacterium]
MEIIGRLGKSQQKSIYITICLFFFILSFLRWEYGSDWAMYKRNFDMSFINSQTEYETLYKNIVLLIRSFTNDYSFVLFVFSCILFYFQSKAIYQIGVLPITSILVLTAICFVNVGYVRQTIALSLTLFSIKYIIERKKIMFVLFVLVAYGFHRSALAFLPAYFLFNVHLNKKMVLWFICGGILLLMLSSVLVPKLSYLLGGVALEKFEGYREAGDVSTTSYDVQTMLIKSLLNYSFIIFIFYNILFVEKELNNSKLKVFFTYYLFAFVIYCTFTLFSKPIARLSLYYDFQWFLFPYIFKVKKWTKYKHLIFVIFILYLSLRLYTSSNAYEGETDTFRFIPEIEKIINY